ncbi:uncharacterized protein LOC135208681 isoform X2 [Macrobrachium nipponense]
MDDVNREMADVSSLTELGPLPFLIRRNSSKSRGTGKVTDKENYISDHPMLRKSYSIPRMNSAERWNNLVGSFRPDNELKAIGLSRNSSLRNSKDFLKNSNAEVVKNHSDFKGVHFTQHSTLDKNAGEVSQKLQLTENTSATENRTSYTADWIRRCLEDIARVADETQSCLNEQMLVDTQGNWQTLVTEQTGNRINNGKSFGQMMKSRTSSFGDYSILRAASQSKEVPCNRPCVPNETFSSTTLNSALIPQTAQHPVNESISNVDEIPEISTNEIAEASESLERDYVLRPQVQCLSASLKNLALASNISISEPELDKASAVPSSCQPGCQVDAMTNESSGLRKSGEDPSPSNKERGNTHFSYIQERTNLETEKTFSEGKRHQSEISPDKSRKRCQTQSTPSTTVKPLKRKVTSSLRDAPDLKKLRRELPVARTSMITRKSIQLLRRELPNRAASYTSRRKAQLFKAAEEGDLLTVRKLLIHAGPAVRDRKKNTLLHVAAANNQVDVVIHLLDLVSPNVTNREGQTPAHVAAVNGHMQMLRILSLDKQFNPDKRDRKQRTFRDLLIAPAFEAVLKGNKNKVKSLIKLGVDFDGHAGKLVNGVLARELQVTSPHQLAAALHGEHFLDDMQIKSSSKFVADGFSSRRTTPKESHTNMGYVCFLHFHSFAGNPELNRNDSRGNATDLAKLLMSTGYSVDIHASMTLEETRQTLRSVRDNLALEESRCAIFVVSSHGTDGSFLTSDMEVLTTEWVMGMFRDSDCPQLKNKPKLFIFDFDSGCHLERIDLRVEGECPRVEEPLNGMISLSAENLLMQGIPRRASFLAVLCKVLRNCQSGKDIADVHRHLVKAYSEMGSYTLPEICSYGRTSKFCVIP